MLYFFVDDDADDQEIFGLAISEVEPDAACVFANDGIEALDKLKDKSFMPAGIFIDLNMPKMNGSECLTEIRKIKRLDPVPVFMYSTSSDPRVMEECRRLGAADFIVKPPGLKALTDRLTRVIQDNELYGGHS
ncbi:response regulator [Sediminibacterium soli]|uniref:response regulator n=1 Tax=Sediminibacterium soli TaxID=2698829 RepID=UPI001F2D4FAC|nr:response regulator [Sediminibacterium soli]